MPFFAFSADFGSLGQNPGLDFYSRIDDAGDGLAQGITTRRIVQYGTYKSFGCSTSWLASERVDQKLLEEVSVGNYNMLMALALKKKANLNTDQLNQLTGCLTEKYRNIKKQAYEDQ